MDPPYGTGLAQSALDAIASGGWLAGGAWVSLEIAREEIAVPAPLSLEAERRFGKARILLLRAQPG
jgi:16S rRNA (guanine966-N2)-methyltransferase